MKNTSDKAGYIHPLELDDLEKAINQDVQIDQVSDKHVSLSIDDRVADSIDESVTISNKETKNKFSSCPKELMDAELNYIRAWRKEQGRGKHTGDNNEQSTSNITGLALSGGGIRSATFSLGVMQALASRDLLKNMDYLSTVSGGGYIGSALTWLLSDSAHHKESTAEQTQKNSDNESECDIPPLPRFGMGAENFPFGSDDPDPAKPKQAKEPQRRILKYLREHGYYLIPGAGINAISLLGIVLRGTFLNLAVWMPIAILLLASFMGFFEHYHFKTLPEIQMFMPFAMLEQHLLGFVLCLSLGFILSALLLLSTLFYSIFTWFSRGNSWVNWLHSRINRNFGFGLPNWYQMRRVSEKLVPKLILVIVLLLLIGSLPIIDGLITDAWVSVGPIAMFSGLLAAMRDFMKPSDDTNSSSSSILAPLAAGLFIFGGLLIAYKVAGSLILQPLWISLVLLCIVLLLGVFVNLNYISIHRYYRDRLMETFMPDISSAFGNETGEAMGANSAKLTDFAYKSESNPPRAPYHIINTNVILTDSKNRIYQKRGGDSFILSPLYCGSNATGWCQTEQFAEGKMTLATAMAISGAAANPNTGVGGEGLTRNHMISYVMALLNLKLGYWVEHPAPDNYIGTKHTPNHFHPGMYHLGNFFGQGGFNEKSAFVQLSDGGHFENTGVYELIRRQAKLIIVCDGGRDSEFSFSDFQTTVRRIEDDFGVRLKVLEDASPDLLVPFSPSDADDSGLYPKNAQFAKQGHMMGHITYADGSDGWLIFLKTTLIEEVSFKVKGYAAQNKDFPDQTTADQFFDEVQFEAYRELGYRLSIKMLESKIPEGVKLEALTKNPPGNIKKLEDFIKVCSA